MSQKFLKTDILDIHAGGRDLIFPHHENEIAQAEALTGKPFAKYWIHHGLLTINAQKMSKSLGNFVTIKDFMTKYKNADLLKVFFLSAHYSHPVDYTEEKIEEARKALERIVILKEKLGVSGPESSSRCQQPGKLKECQGVKEVEDIKSRFIAAMDDDFNTPQALACVFELVNAANKNIEDTGFCAVAKTALMEFLKILGISLSQGKSVGDVSDTEVETKIQERNNARKNKDFALSDKIRKELEGIGVILEDMKDGTTWRRKL